MSADDAVTDTVAAAAAGLPVEGPAHELFETMNASRCFSCYRGRVRLLCEYSYSNKRERGLEAIREPLQGKVLRDRKVRVMRTLSSFGGQGEQKGKFRLEREIQF
ncbi:MAG: hypothetical protein D6740_12875 [Alphaproteobacteria bacterium]|nr:MAG: hypothetical protein D6740_12875 [Alphaproteobacteria bacterium]